MAWLGDSALVNSVSSYSSGVGERVGYNSRREKFISVCDQPPTSTQPGHHSVGIGSTLSTDDACTAISSEGNGEFCGRGGPATRIAVIRVYSLPDESFIYIVMLFVENEHSLSTLK